MYNKYGKSFVDLLYMKNDMIEENQKYLDAMDKITDIYCKQPLRKECTVCGHSLGADVYFKSHGIDYKLCGVCGNLNGAHEDTEEFCRRIYTVSDYGENYYSGSKEAYLRRTHAIYEPKAKFLIDSLNLLNEDTYNLEYFEFGAGCGYMLNALRSLGIEAKGVDASPGEVAHGNKMLSGDYLTVVPIEDIYSRISETTADVALFMGVLEHLRDLKRTFAAIASNKKIKYIYFNVPLFSLTCLLEIVNQQYFNRHLGGAHTHLYTKNSLDWIYKEYNFTPVAVWDFGSEVMDLRRFMLLELKKQGASEQLIDKALEFFKHNGDDIQMAIDRSGFASETHVLVKNG